MTPAMRTHLLQRPMDWFRVVSWTLAPVVGWAVFLGALAVLDALADACLAPMLAWVLR